VQLSATSHAPADARHTVPAFPAGCVQATLLPSHTSRVQTLPSSVHGVFAGDRASAGQAELAPEHVSWGSHAPADARQTVPATAS
jgi:hypothetical protein